MSSLRDAVESQILAHALLDPAAAGTPERIASARVAHGLIMQITDLLTEGVTRAKVNWKDLHFAAAFEEGVLTISVGGCAASLDDDAAAAAALSRALKDHDLLGVVEVVLPG